MNPVQRSLRDDERALLHFLLSADFPGREELKKQAETVRVVGECQCGCGTIELRVVAGMPPAKVNGPIPIEAYGEAIDVLLFARNGVLGSLEIVFYANPPERPYPRPEQLKLWKRPGPALDQAPPPHSS
jgi:hypothetical protein